MSTTADARCVGCAVGAGERPGDAPPGYVSYPAYGEPLPGPNCSWFRMPIYDVYGNMVGWRGRPVAVCSWLAGYRATLGDAAAEVLRLVSRDLERAAVAPTSPARRGTPLSAVE